MQKLEYIDQPSSWDTNRLNDEYLSQGWIVKKMIIIDKNLIVLLEKITRKEKLEHINNLK